MLPMASSDSLTESYLATWLQVRILLRPIGVFMKDYEFGECPLWYKLAIVLVVCWGVHVFYQGLCTF